MRSSITDLSCIAARSSAARAAGAGALPRTPEYFRQDEADPCPGVIRASVGSCGFADPLQGLDGDMPIKRTDGVEQGIIGGAADDHGHGIGRMGAGSDSSDKTKVYLFNVNSLDGISQVNRSAGFQEATLDGALFQGVFGRFRPFLGGNGEIDMADLGDEKSGDNRARAEAVIVMNGGAARSRTFARHPAGAEVADAVPGGQAGHDAFLCGAVAQGGGGFGQLRAVATAGGQRGAGLCSIPPCRRCSGCNG